MPELPENDGTVVTDEEKVQRLAALDFVFNIGPNEMFPSKSLPAVSLKCKQCGAERKSYQGCEECGAKWPT